MLMPANRLSWARRGRAAACVLAASAAGVLAACGSAVPSGGSDQPTPTSSAARPADCADWGCRPVQTVELPDQRKITLLLGRDEQNFRSRPVLELLDHGVTVQWWISPQGDGWNGRLTCEVRGPEPNCVLVDSVGMHSNVAEMVILRAGRLIHPTDAAVTTDVTGMRAVDLDGDRYLDVIGSTNDYQPNYAQGHNYWQTFQYRDGSLASTGCAPQPQGAPAPTHLLTGSCPAA